VTHGAWVVDPDTTVLRGTIEFVVDGEAMTLTEGQLAALPGRDPPLGDGGRGRRGDPQRVHLPRPAG
jgi:hypothetical protein